MAALRSIHDLPPEILSQVFEYLTEPVPSERMLFEEPHKGMLCAAPAASDEHSRGNDDGWRFSGDLKSISQINKKWRSFVLPILFRSVVWQPPVTSLNVFDLQPIPLLQFLMKNDLVPYVTTFTLMIYFYEDEIDPAQVPHQLRPSDLEWLWDQLFSVIDPLRFTIIAPPTTLAGLLNRMLFLDDAWSFDIPYHVLSLARPSRETKHGAQSDFDPGLSTLPPHSPLETSSPHARSSYPSGGAVPAPPCPLFTHRPWTSILLNEGSAIRAYQTYEFFLRQPPSMLSALLGIGEYPNNQPLLPPTIVDFNYIAIFPLASHVHQLFQHLPRVDRLFVQLTPRPGNEVLQDHAAMRKIDRGDLWMERNTAYSHLFAELTAPEPDEGWLGLKVFESGDAADRESWDMAVEFLARSEVGGWGVEREGVLVRMPGDASLAGSDENVEPLEFTFANPGINNTNITSNASDTIMNHNLAVIYHQLRSSDTIPPSGAAISSSVYPNLASHPAHPNPHPHPNPPNPPPPLYLDPGLADLYHRSVMGRHRPPQNAVIRQAVREMVRSARALMLISSYVASPRFGE